MIYITQEKFKCPAKNCDIEAEGLHRLIRHFRGTHIKEKDSKVIKEALAAIENSNEDEVREALLKEFSEYGPEMDVADEEKIDVRKCDGVDDEFILNKYLNNTICREERQYALFLASGLKRNNSALKDMLRLSTCEILEVFYEATLMRDYWCRNRVAFNELLRDFAENEKKLDSEIGSNGNEKYHANYWKKKHPLACWMMNAKPDIAVLYKAKDYKVPTLSFIECKYLSRVDNYYYNGKDRFEYTQVKLQGLILEFLCNELKLKYSLENDNQIEEVNKGKMLLARFVNGDRKPDKRKRSSEEFEIPITDLIKIGY